MSVPLFPLPNVVLFPGAVLPLHIFEERYKAMTANVIAGDGQIAMALLRLGWEKNYHCKPMIDPIVCVGRISGWEKLDDGRYNFLLHGQARAKVIDEKDESSLYRVARVERLHEIHASDQELLCKRRRFLEMFSSEPLASLPVTSQLNKIISSPLPTDTVADLVAFHLLGDIPLKQSLLAETDVAKRIDRVLAALDAALPVLELTSRGTTRRGNYN